MARSTVDVSFLVEKANYFLANSEDGQSEQRRGVCGLLEVALHESGNYNGFAYLGSAGMVKGPTGYAESIADESRRRYYTPALTGIDVPAMERLVDRLAQ